MVKSLNIQLIKGLEKKKKKNLLLEAIQFKALDISVFILP